MAEVTLQNVTKVYPPDVKAVDDIDLYIADREFLVLVGPSGCGKSTTLRMIAGLEDISAGEIRIDGRVVNGVAPKDRDIAMVFQNYALYPHMSVYKNMAFGLMLRRKHGGWGNPLGYLLSRKRFQQAREERGQIDRSVRNAAAVLGIEDLLHRRPRALSGGQRQRVAVGRAIVRNPKAFLFDEPLSNLDAKLRVEMRAELKSLHRQVQTTTIYVTHDQEEAMTLGDRVVVMKDGVIHQLGTPFDVYRHPVNRFVASFVGTPPMNFLDGHLEHVDGRLVFVAGDNRLVLCAAHQKILGGVRDQPLTIGIRPEALRVRTAGQPGTILHLQVNVVEPLGDRMDVHASTEQQIPFVCRIDADQPVREGEAVEMLVDMARAHFFETSPPGRNISLPEAVVQPAGS
ncbi:MAG: ATP-binding cassette domain-containing protein [Planctomycetota bacterium]